jgi:transglutaminase-like putative cysteine protease
VSAPAVVASRPSRLPGPARVRPLLPPLAARVASFGALAAFGALHWADLVRPAAPGRMIAALALAGACGLAVAATAGARRAVRVSAAGAIGLAGLLAALATAGAPSGLLAPAGWGGLAGGLGQGFQGLAEVRVPYDGSDPWPAIALLFLGAGLLLGGGLATFAAPRRGRAVGALALGALYAVPAVDVPGSHELLRGAAFAALLLAYLRLDRIPARAAPGALAAVATALALGLALAPGLDRGRPWIDYQAIARDLASGGTVSYDFDHRYGPLDWPRTGEELLRVSAPRQAYWKAEDLDAFDGVRWRRAPDGGGESQEGQLPDSPAQVRRWSERVRVTVRGLRTEDLVAAGTTLDVRGAPSAAVPVGPPGTLRAESTLTGGDSYVADVYFPRPGPRELARARTADAPQLGGRYLTLTLPQAGGTAPVDVRFGAFGSGQPALLLARSRDLLGLSPARALRDSPYAPAYALARRLAARSRTPYEVVQRVLSYLAQGGFVYTEDPPTARYPLESFLFRDRAGYCQHFSGAMALLLRMAGVPARVAGGFTPGTYDRRRHEWVVRDYDAHSWVEAHFPGTGWVTFDPTPAASPARSQLIPVGLPPSPTAPLRPDRVPIRGDRPEPGGRAPVTPAATAGHGGATRRIALALALLAAGGLAVAFLATGGAARRRTPGAGGELAELERALRRCGLTPAPPTTLRGLERRDPDASGYLRALADRRYGFGDGHGPTAAQRRALRRALARSAGRARALWALPPRLRGRPLH